MLIESFPAFFGGPTRRASNGDYSRATIPSVGFVFAG
jgi:hypothetical protein